MPDKETYLVRQKTSIYCLDLRYFVLLRFTFLHCVVFGFCLSPKTVPECNGWIQRQMGSKKYFPHSLFNADTGAEIIL